MAGTRSPGNADFVDWHRHGHEKSILAEVRMLLDHVGMSSSVTIADLKVRWRPPPDEGKPPAQGNGADEGGPFMSAQQILERLDTILGALRDTHGPDSRVDPRMKPAPGGGSVIATTDNVLPGALSDTRALDSHVDPQMKPTQGGSSVIATTDDVLPGASRDTRALDSHSGLQMKPTQDGSSVIAPTDVAFLHLVRDALNVMVRPASGMTVAYTWMVTGGTRVRKGGPRLDLAKEAYPALEAKAWRHRLCTYIFLVLALLATTFAVWEATKVALGKSLLSSLQELRLQQSQLNLEKSKLETKAESPGEWNGTVLKDKDLKDTKLSLRLCDNTSYRFQTLDTTQQQTLQKWAKLHAAIEQKKSASLGKAPPHEPEDQEIQIFGSPAEREVCDRDQLLATNFGVFFVQLRRYGENWPPMVGRSFEAAQGLFNGLLEIGGFIAGMPLRIADGVTDWLGARRRVTNPAGHRTPPIPVGGPAQDSDAKPTVAAAPGDDIEWVVVARLLVLGNYVLPVVFSLLGSIAYVMVDYFSKVRGSLLSPRDLPLAWIRMVLGLVVGACIGLLYSSSSPVMQIPGTVANVGNLLNSLTLSASGVAFLAGFGVEGVFSMLEMLVRRVFPTNNEGSAK